MALSQTQAGFSQLTERTRYKKRPLHVGPSVLPNFPVFSKLLLFAQDEKTIAINDVTHNIRATYAQLLSDTLNLRNAVWNGLDEEVRYRLLRNEEVYINIIAVGSYEFAAAFLAVLALGAIIVPISVQAPLEEVLYFAKTAQSAAVLTSRTCAATGNQLAESIKSTGNPNFFSLEILPLICQSPIPVSQILISADHFLDYNAAGFVIFTSGTSGPPKGVSKRRAFLDTASTAIAQWYQLRYDDVVLHTLPVHHATGIGVTFMPYLLSGACIEFSSSGFDPAQIWERWRQGGLTVFSGVPTMYMRLMRYFEQNISKRSPKEVESYTSAARSFRLMMSGSAALPQPLQLKWIKVLNGKRILERYGATEFSSIFSVKPGDSNNPDGSVGKVFPGQDVKLSDGDEGEVLIKSPHLFIEYIQDPAATAAAYNSEGYYKTGDIARRENDYYFMLGRASIDIIKSGGYKISALDIERQILGLDYISEAMVVGLEDEEYGQRIGAAIVMRQQDAGLTIRQLRGDLGDRLANYKLPTVLRVVPSLPKSASGKIVKRTLKKEIFPQEGHPEVQVYIGSKSKL